MTVAKLGVSTYLEGALLGKNRATGKHLAELVLKHLNSSFIAVVADNTGNNTGSQSGLFALLKARRPTLLCIGCCVHVLDLLMEDLAKIPAITAVSNDAHFLTSFVKKHPLLYEEFLVIQKSIGVKLELVLFPLTRFAYVHLMCYRAWKNFSALRLLSESDTFTLVKQQVRRRGQSGQRAVEEFNRFEDLAGTRSVKMRLRGVASVLQPFSQVLHYLEGDSVPISHVYPCYQLLYDFSQEIGQLEELTNVLSNEEEQDLVVNAVRQRWLGSGRKVGLRDELHFCAFVLDPYAQAAMTSPRKPDCDLLTTDVIRGARSIIDLVCGEDMAKRSMLKEQLGMWCAAAPRIPFAGTSLPVATGHNAFSSLYFTGMQLMWEKILGDESSRRSEGTSTAEAVGSSTGADGGTETAPITTPDVALECYLNRLKLCKKPTDFWLAMAAEKPTGMRVEALEAHRAFCIFAVNILAIVGHTAGVERAGKDYGMILTTLRKRMEPERAHKSIFIMHNYSLIDMAMDGGTSYAEFGRPPDEASEDLAEGLQRRSLIVEDEAGWDDDDSDSSDGPSAAEEGEPEEIVEPVSWSVPNGFRVADKPSAIDERCVNMHVFMKWEGFGWQLGKISEVLTSATPRLVKKYNVRVVWADARGPAMLDLQSYQHGDDAPFDSWVFLTPVHRADE